MVSNAKRGHTVALSLKWLTGIEMASRCAETPHMCGDSDTCAEIELNHTEPGLFSHPCANTPTRAETPIRAKTRILTVYEHNCCFSGRRYRGRGLMNPRKGIKR